MSLLRALKYVLGVGVTGATSVVALDHYDVIDLTESGKMRGIRTALTTCSIILDYKRSLQGVDVESFEYQEAKSQAHSRSAQKLLHLVWKNRGTYVKVGQHLGGMDYLLPKEYCQTLRILHSSAPQSDVEDIKKVIAEELNVGDISEVFSQFDPKPLGTASLAQVHKARLKKDGNVVAVKVQHPNVKSHAEQDMQMMSSSLQQVIKFFPEFDLMWLSEETKANLPIELDFRNEVRNALRAAENLQCFPWVKLPHIYMEYCSSRVLTMEYVEGGQVDDRKYCKEHGIDFNRVSRLLGTLFSEMIFVHGFVHSDPHPGNILINTKKVPSFWGEKDEIEIILLDHGLYRELSEEFRFSYASLWQAIINNDLPEIEHWARELGSADMYPLLSSIVTGRSWEVVGEKGITNVEFTQDEDNALRDEAGEVIGDISHILGKIPREMLLVLKTNDHLRGLEHYYGVRGDASGFLDMSKCCLRSLHNLKMEKNQDTDWQSYYDRFHLRVTYHLDVLKISLYEWYMWYWESSGDSSYDMSSNEKKTGIMKDFGRKMTEDECNEEQTANGTRRKFFETIK